MSYNISFPLLLFVVFAFCLSGNGVHAFGAGNIPSFAYMEGRAFRHGDIEDVLSQLVKRGAGGGFALASILSKGHKFNGLDIKRVYFGNWLRDYSQAVDIASLKKLPLQTIINMCMALGFMAHGYATNEFEVTEERLGVYLPTEHIDNPRGYGEGEDARKYHPKLRGPVDPQELQIDTRTGMKNYIANENGGWDTSKALVRRTLERCIHHGRQHRANGQKQDEYEAYRLLGQSLHTLEDYSAHSNFCELSLVSMGQRDVFVHVGEQVRVQAPNGQWVAPIVTGSFGSSDFIHSLLGEATDHLSSASVTDLNKELDAARSKSQAQATRGGPSNPGDALRGLLFTLPGGEGGEMTRDMEAIERIRAGPTQGGKRPEDMSPQELHAVLWQVLTFRDSVVKKISKTIEKIPGLGPLIEKIMDSISVFVFTTLEPFLKPILKTATSGLQAASGEVIDNRDQYEVFNDPHASDPTHSFLSKDHFNLILNEPAGQLAKIIVIHTVNLVTKAWDDNSQNVHQVTEEVLQCLFHPDFHNSNSKIQREMLQCMRDWVQKQNGKTLQRLSKNSVRNHENIRLAGEGGAPASQGTFAESQAHQFQHTLQGYAANVPGFSQAQSLLGGAGANFPRRDGEPGGAGYPGAPQGHGSASAPPPPMTGQAASYYGGGGNESQQHGGQGHQPAHQQQHGSSSYGPPSGPPPGAGSSSYGPPSGPPPGAGSSSYGPPSGPPPGAGSSFPSSPSAPQAPHRSGYAPAYSPPPPSFPGGNSSIGSAPSFPGAPPSFPGGPTPPPSFPGAAPSFPGSGPSFPGGPDDSYGGGGGGGYRPPPGPPGGPGFPGAGPGFPDTGPGFPGADPYGQQPPQFPGGPGHEHGHGHHGGQPGYPGYGGHQQHGQHGQGGGW